jgi:putative spermidine/putrescine transport system ATP-binding protein
MGSNKEFVKFENVDKSYDGKVLVVKGLNLDIAEGEFITMLGPSGSGKTTCLMMLAGFETPTNGEIYLDGKAISSIPPHKRGIGMVFQNYALFPHMTVYENLAFPLRVRKIPKDEADKKIDKALSMVSLQGFASRMPGQLSGGQQQRVAVARSLVFDPQLVLMDEPLGALDKNLRESMQYEIKHIHESIGVTVVYVTHDQSEALTMSNRIAVFNDGKVQQLSSPDELYEKPVNSFVAEFIGENNTFAGEVSDISKDKCKVKLANAEILANPISVKAKGDKTTVSLRPERALINPSDKMDNVHNGKIEEVIYHGDHTRVRINLLGNSEFILKVPNSSSNTSSSGNSFPSQLSIALNVFGSISVTILSSTLRKSISPIGNTYVMKIKNKRGATRRKALILFFLSAFLRLTSRGIPSEVRICFASELINKKGG